MASKAFDDALAVVSGASEAMCSRSFNDFWLLAALTERSFEEGDRNRVFRESVVSYENAGVTGPLISQLRGGINERLASAIQQTGLAADPVMRNPSKGSDLKFSTRNTGTPVEIEVKMIYDMTFKKYYTSIVDDIRKLEALRIAGFPGELFLIVFFIQLPGMDYPAGTWYQNKPCKSRSGFLVVSGIQDQYKCLREQMTKAPIWPNAEPLPAYRLVHPTAEVSEHLLMRWFESVFQPRGPWKFTAATHLRDAAVGVAIWNA